MATTSFAVGSVAVAIVWGTFFYPPPAQRANSAPAVTAPTRAAAPLVNAPEAPPKETLPTQHPSLALAGQALAVTKP